MSKFRDYVTSTAFHLSLSRRQIEMLSQLDHYGYAWGTISTCNAMVDKGLCERQEDPCGGMGKVVITGAGKLVLPLLKAAGLYIEYPKWEEPVELPPIDIVIRRKGETEDA